MSQRIQVILVDDDIDDRQMTASALDEADTQVPYLYMEDGIKLLEYLENTVSDELLPSLIVLDMHMPVLSGLTVLLLLKEHRRYKAIPVVMLSVSLNNKDKQACIDNGAIDYIDKPNDYNAYKKIVDKLHRYNALSSYQQKIEYALIKA